MNHLTHFRTAKISFLCAILFALAPLAAQGAFNADLQGQSATAPHSHTPTGTYISTSLQNWEELDMMPFRVLMQGGPVTGQTITVSFDHQKTLGSTIKPGIQNLVGFTPSAGVTITSGPTLIIGTGDVWRYAFTVNMTTPTGDVRFTGNLSAGAHDFGGASLAVSGTPSLGNLSILKPLPAPGSPDLAVTKTGPATAAPGGVVTYTLSYSNTTAGPIPTPATGAQLTDTLPAGLTYVPGSASCTGTCTGTPAAVGNQIVWNLGALPLGASGSQTFQATLSPSATDGQNLVNMGTIASAENDWNPANNDTSFTTAVVSTSSATAVAAASGSYGGTTTLSATLTSGATPLAGKTVSFFLNGVSVGSATTNGSGVATLLNTSLSGINVGFYPAGVGSGVEARFAGAAPYAFSSGNNSLTVTKATLVIGPAGINITPYNVAYDGTNHTATGTVTGINGEDLTGLLDLSGTTHSDAGAYPSDPWSFAGNDNYNGTSGTVSDNISRATLVIGPAGINITPYNVVYDGAAHTATGTVTGLNGEDLSGLLDLSGTTHTVSGAYPSDPWSFAGNANYNSVSGTVSDNISRATLIIGPAGINITPYDVVYNGAAHTATGTVTGAAGEDLSSLLDLSSTTHTNVGDYAADTWIFAGNENYNSASGIVHDKISRATLVIGPAGIDITPYDVVYNGAAHTATGTVTGAAGEDLSSLLDLSGTTHTNVGDYAADAWSFAGNENYNSASGTVHDKITRATLVIGPAGINITPYDVVYNGAAHTATGTVTGAAGEDLSSLLDLSGTTHTNVGDYAADAWSFAGNENYNSASGTVNDKITRATLVIGPAGINITPYDVVYNGAAHTATGTVTGAAGEDLSSLLDLSGTTHTNVGDYAADAWSFAGNENYNSASGTVNDKISRATLVIGPAGINITPYDVVYNGAAHTATGTVTGAAGEDLSSLLDLSGTTHTNVGDYAADAWSFAGDENYNSASGIIHDKISRATLVVGPAGINITPYDVVFNGAAHTATGTVTGAAGEDLSSLLDLSGTTHTNVGDYAADAWSFAGNENYNSASGTVHDKITRATLVIGPAGINITPYDVVYNGAAHTATGTVTGAAGEDLSSLLDLSDTTHTNVGDYAADAWSFAGNENYNSASGTIHDKISRATLVVGPAGINITPYDIVYNGAAHTATGTVTGAAGEDLSSLLDLSGTTHTNVGDYAADAWSFAGNANYNSASGIIHDKITRAALVIGPGGIDITPYDVVYNSEPHTATGTVTGANGEDLSNLLDLSGTTHTTVGDYPTDVWSFAGNENYSSASGTVHDKISRATLVIGPAGINITPYDVAYNSAAHTATGTATGLNGEDLSNLLDLSGTTHTNVGDYPADVWSFAGNENYNSASGTVHDKITRATLVIGPAGINITPYDVAYNSAPHTATGTATGLNGEDLSNLLDLTGTTHTNAGDYPADVWNFAGNENYNSASGTVHDKITRATLVIGPAGINITAYDVVYNSAPHTATGTATGLNGEDLSNLLDLSGTTHTNVGDYPADVWNFAGNANYNSATGTVHDKISRASLVIGPAGINIKPYDVAYNGEAHTATGTATGLNGEDLSDLLDLSGTTHTSVGDYPADVWNFAGNANYNSASGTVHDKISRATLVIGPAGINIKSYNVVYDGAKHTATGTATGVNGEDLSKLLDLSGTSHTDAGGYKSDPWIFAGNGNYNPAKGTVKDNISQASTATGVTSTLNPSQVGQSVTFSAVVNSKGGTPTGTIQFKDNGSNVGHRSL